MNTNTGNNVRNTRGASIGAKTKLSKFDVNEMMKNFLSGRLNESECLKMYNIQQQLFNKILRAKGAYKYLRLTEPFESFSTAVKKARSEKKVVDTIENKIVVEQPVQTIQTIQKPTMLRIKTRDEKVKELLKQTGPGGRLKNKASNELYDLLYEDVLLYKLEEKFTAEIAEILNIPQHLVKLIFNKWKQNVKTDEDKQLLLNITEIGRNNQLKATRTVNAEQYTDYIFAKIIEGYSQSKIAKDLNISTKTISNVYNKYCKKFPNDQKVIDAKNSIIKQKKERGKKRGHANSEFPRKASQKKYIISSNIDYIFSQLLLKRSQFELSKEFNVSPSYISNAVTEYQNKFPNDEKVIKYNEIKQELKLARIEKARDDKAEAAAKAAETYKEEVNTDKIIDHGDPIEFHIEDMIEYTHRTHYLKWQIRGDISIRYHEVFQDKPDLVGKFILKDHESSTWEVISKRIAQTIIKGGNTDEVVEIYGYLNKGEYHKLIKPSKTSGWFHRNETELDKAHDEILSRKNWTKVNVLEKTFGFQRIIDKKIFTLYIDRMIGQDEYEFHITILHKSENKQLKYLSGSYEQVSNFIKKHSNLKNDQLFIPTKKRLVEIDKEYKKQ